MTISREENVFYPDRISLSFYKDRLENCNVKDMYRIVKELLNKDNNPIPDSECPSQLANEFGDFFIGKVQKIRNEVDRIGAKLETDKSDNMCNPYDMQSEKCSNIFRFDTFKHVSEEDLLQVVSKCPNKSCSLDILPTWLLKQHINVLLPVFARIVNMSLPSGIFPADLRTAIITPVLKKTISK